MKKLVTGVVGLLAVVSGSSAMAADLAARTYTKAPAPAIAYNWSGFYIGANGGGAWGRECWNLTSANAGVTIPTVGEGCHTASGGLVGGQIGYRWQAAAWVFGVEAQGDWANLKGTRVSSAAASAALAVAAGNLTNQSKIDAVGLFTGQVGYSWTNLLWYAKGGAAVTADRYSGILTVAGLGTFVADKASETRWGGAVGTGLEYGLTPNWSLGIEYDHLFMGSRNLTMTSSGNNAPAGIFSRIDRIGQDIDMVTARVDYRFGGPLVARY